MDEDPPAAWIPSGTIPTGLSSITTFRFTPDGKQVLVSTDFGELALFDRTGRALWKLKPFPNSKNAIFIADIHPDGRTFLTYTGIGAAEDHLTLNFHDMRTGRITRSISEESTFYQPRATKDHRKPPQAEIAERKDAGLGEYWILMPRDAKFVRGGKQILVTWVNSMSGPDMYDRHFQLHDAATGRRIWEYTIVADQKNFDDDQPAGFKIGLPRPPIVEHPQGKGFLYGTPHARIHVLDEKTIQESAKKELVEEKTAGPELANPRHTKPSYDELTQAVSDLVVDPAKKLLFVAAGSGAEEIVHVYDLKSMREIARSPQMAAEKIRLSSDGGFLVTMSRQVGSTRLINLKTGTLEYKGGQTIEWNPAALEFAELSGDDLVIFKRK